MAQIELGEKQLIISLEEYMQMKKENDELKELIESYKAAIGNLFKLGIDTKMFRKAKNFELKKLYNNFDFGPSFRYAIIFDLEEDIQCR